MFKIIFDNLRLMLRTSQIRPNLPHHFRLVLGTISTYCIGLDILIEKFVRIQLRTVSRKVEQLNSFSIPIHPAFDLSGTMNRMTIYNQKNLLPVLFDQSSKKSNHHVSSKSLLEDHKGQTTSVGNRRDHIAAKSLTGSWNDGRVSFEAITASGLMVRTHSHFVAPVDLSTFCAGLPANCRSGGAARRDVSLRYK